MHQQQRSGPQWLIAGYYGSTVIFVLLDYVFDFNVRLVFLEQWPGWRALYYVFCFACFLLIWRFPAWSNTIAAAESLITVSALILSMGLRVFVVTDAMIEEGQGVVSLHEVLNFVLSGGVAYVALLTRSRAAEQELRGIGRGS